mgnify:FL=1
MDDAGYAALGRKQLELEQLHAEYDRLLTLLAAVVGGEIETWRVRVDRQARQWALLPDLPQDGVATGVRTDDEAVDATEEG